MENVYKLLRIASNMSMKELAEKMGVSPAYVSEVEKGKRIPSNALRKKYSEVLNVKESTILYFDEENREKEPTFQSLLLQILEKLVRGKESD